MKFTDINQELTEAPDLSKIKGKLQRAGTKIKSKNPLSKEMRTKSSAKANVQQTGLKIKDQFHAWVGETGSEQTLEDFKAFIDQNMQELSGVFDEVALELKFKKPEPEPEPEPEAQADDSADQQVDATSGEDQEDMISPEEITGEKGKPGEQSEEEVRAVYDKQGEELEAKRKAQGGELADESVEEDADDAEPKVDMSASIYESRLKALLTEATKLNDNQLDTLIVRLMQRAKKGGATQPAAEKPAAEKPAAEPEKEKGDGWRQKFSKAMTGTGNVSDIGKGSFGGGEDGGSAPSIDPDDLRALTGLLSTVAKGKAGPKEKKVAGKLLQSIKNTYGE